MACSPHTNGYARFMYMINGIRRYKVVHRVVAEHFLGIDKHDIVIHKNKNLLDNNVNNLLVKRSALNIQEIITNALGSQHFDPDQVIEVLTKEADRIRQEGGNPGSLIALANILPEITAEAKKRY